MLLLRTMTLKTTNWVWINLGSRKDPEVWSLEGSRSARLIECNSYGPNSSELIRIILNLQFQNWSDFLSTAEIWTHHQCFAICCITSLLFSKHQFHLMIPASPSCAHFMPLCCPASPNVLLTNEGWYVDRQSSRSDYNYLQMKHSIPSVCRIFKF